MDATLTFTLRSLFQEHGAIVIVALVVVVALVAIAIVARARGTRARFSTQPLDSTYLTAYEERLAEIEKMFVAQPREAVAASRQLVDDMLTRMGYPVRLTPEERLKDVRAISHEHGDRYAKAVALGPTPSTEELRRALQGHLDMARDLIAKSGPTGQAQTQQLPT